jgi:hypothetical protein
MRLPWRRSGRQTSLGCAWLSLLWLSVAPCGCTVEDAYGADQATTPADGGTKQKVGKRRHGPLNRAATPAATTSAARDPLVGLTRAQVKARRGPPTQKRGQEWLYTPDQGGCDDLIVSEIVVFKDGVVAGVRPEMTRTEKVCRGERKESD